MKLKDRVALRIKTIRRRRGLTQEGLAERISRTVDAISNLERGKSLPSFETLEKLSEALDVPLRDFFDNEPPRQNKAGAERITLMTTLVDLARDLSDSDLQIAVEQIETLARRRSTSRSPAKSLPSGKR